MAIKWGRVNLYIKSGDKELFDKAMAVSGLGISETVAEAIAEYVERRGPWYKAKEALPNDDSTPRAGGTDAK